MKKRQSNLLVLAFLAMTLASCGGDTTSSNISTSEQSTSENPTSIIEQPSSSQSSLDEIKSPTFSASSYSYDKNSGGAMEMPLELYGANIYFVSFNDNNLPSSSYSYDETKKCLLIAEEYVLSIEIGNYEVKVVTDADNTEPAVCTLVIENSVITSFDEERNRSFAYGIDLGVEYNVDFKTATVKSLLQGKRIIDEQYYKLENNKLFIDKAVLSQYYGDIDFTVILTNNDRYTFTINSNVIFYTDYDVTTIHNETVSTIGHNPLYQYADGESVKVIDGSSLGMSGNVLKYTPNTSPVQYDCHGLYTLKSPSCSYMWYDVGYSANALYAFEFDYLTENTTVGDFYFKLVDGTIVDTLLLGEENDNKVHHFRTVVSGADIKDGTMVWAYFENGSGNVYFDNFRVTEITSQPTIGTVPEYNLEGSLEIPFNSYGYEFDIYYGEEKVQYTYENGNIIINESYLDNFAVGAYDFVIKTLINDYVFKVRIVDNSVAKLIDTTYYYEEGVAGEAVLKGSFSSKIEILSIKQKARTYNSAYEGWEFYHYSDYDYKNEVTLNKGENGEGGILLSQKLLNRVAGEGNFVIEFSNGKSAEFTIYSNRTHISNYDDLTINGYFNGTEVTGSPFASGMNGAVVETKEREKGNNAFYITDTSATADSTYFTLKLHSHVWDWYYIDVDQNQNCRIRFNYQLSGFGEKDVYYEVLVTNGYDVVSNFFGNYDEVNIDNNDWDEVRWYLNNDGQVHEFDSGWFTWTDTIRLMKLVIPKFTATENKFVMLDDFAFSQSSNPIEGLTHKLGEGDLVFNSKYEVTNVKIDNTDIEFTYSDGKVAINESQLSVLAPGNHNMKIETSVGSFGSTFNLTSSLKANLTETSKTYYHGNTVTLAGEFSDNIEILSATKYGSHIYDTSINGQSVSVDGFEMSSTGLTIKNSIADYLYGTTRFVLTMSNGETLDFSVTNDALYYTDFTNTTVWSAGEGNIPSIQDTSMVTFENDGNRTYLLYQPGNATLGHSTAVGGEDNGIFTIKNPEFITYNWHEFNFDPNKKYEIVINYELTGISDDAYVALKEQLSTGKVNKIKLNQDENVFTYEISGADIALFYLCTIHTTAEARSNVQLKVYSYAIYEK